MARTSTTIKVKGLAELGRNIALLQKDVAEKEVRTAARLAAGKVAKKAKAIVTAKGLVKTGNMRDAIRAKRMSKASREGYEVYAVGVFRISKNAKTGKKFTYANSARNRRKGRAGKAYEVDSPEFYWKFIELGTVKMSPKPFLVPAFSAEKAGAPGVMGASLEKGIKKSVGKMTVIKK